VSDTIVGLVGGAVLAALVTLAGTYYFWVLQRSRKELGYEVLSANVIIPKLQKPTPDIQVMARSSLLRDDGGEADYVPVDEVFGFRIRVRNTGNVPVENQDVAFIMDYHARVISVEMEEYPELTAPSAKISLQDPYPSSARATIPYLNPGKDLIFSLQSVNNYLANCFVEASAPGLECYDMYRRRFFLWLTTALLLAIALVGPPAVLKLLDVSGQVSIGGSTPFKYYAFSSWVAAAFPVLYLAMAAVSWVESRRSPERKGGRG